MEKMRNAYDISVGKPEGKRQLERRLGGKIILEWILGKQDGSALTACIWFRIGTSEGIL
jgi:hypothetical protein